MDPILKFSYDKQKFASLLEEPTDFYQIVNLAKSQNISTQAALSACVDIYTKMDEDRLLIDFLKFSARHANKSEAQLLQDLFAAFFTKKNGSGKFLEFGATDGVSLSNTYMLENVFGWDGVLAEPSPQWHTSLLENRKNARVIRDCVWIESDLSIDFFVSDVGVLSSIDDFKRSDEVSMPGNSNARNNSGYTTKVKTISLNDLVREHFPDGSIDYISVDTEGSEYEILNCFDLEKFGPSVLTVEHNYTSLREKIDDLMKKFGYGKVFDGKTAFDAWYVKSEILDNFYKT